MFCTISLFAMIVLLIPITVIAVLYVHRWLHPIPNYPIVSKLAHTLIGHRARPLTKTAPRQAKTDAFTLFPSSLTESAKSFTTDNGSIPENSLASFRYAAQSGVRCVEFDVQMTKDRHPVVFHDMVVHKTLQVPPGFEGSKICDWTLAELKAMPFLSALEDTLDTYHQERVPTLEEVLSICKEHHLLMMIEIKPQPNLSQCCASVVDLVLKSRLEDDVYIASFSPIALYYIRSMTSKICTGYLYAASASGLLAHEFNRQRIAVPWFLRNGIITSTIDTIIRAIGSPWFLHLLGHSIAAIDYRYISPYQVHRYKAAGITVLTWTVNEYTTQKYFYEVLQVSVITDYPLMELS